MPKGLIVSVWDNVSGVSIEAEYPKEATNSINAEDLLTLFTANALTKEAGILTMNIRQNSLISYYGGPSIDKFENQILVVLIISEDDDPNIMENYIKGISHLIINCLEREGELSEVLIIDCFDAAKKNSAITKEQLLSILLRDDLNSFILQLLREGPIIKEQFGKYISDQFKQKITNIDKYLKPFVDNGLVLIHKIKESMGRTSEYLFLIKDVYLYRTPPIETLVNLEEIPNLADKFYKEIEEFFMDYKPTLEDSKKLADIISNPVKYEILKLLRKQFVKYDLLSQQMGFNPKNLYANLTELLKNKIAVAIKDQTGGYWLFLMNDIQVVQEFPRYMIDLLHESIKHNEIDEMVALKHAELLKDELITEKLEVLK